MLLNYLKNVGKDYPKVFIVKVLILMHYDFANKNSSQILSVWFIEILDEIFENNLKRVFHILLRRTLKSKSKQVISNLSNLTDLVFIVDFGPLVDQVLHKLTQIIGHLVLKYLCDYNEQFESLNEPNLTIGQTGPSHQINQTFQFVSIIDVVNYVLLKLPFSICLFLGAFESH